jgi:transposase-like protein
MEGHMGTPKTLVEAIRFYSDPDHCQAVMVEVRWPRGVACPTCGRPDVRYIATRRLWECKTAHPRKQFSAKVGTIFEDSPLGLDKWLTAVWLVANCKNGVSSYEVARALGVTQKTAWFMMHRIRAAMRTGSFRKLSGEVEVDETFIGGKARFMHHDKRVARIKGTGSMGKTAVMGMLERHGPDGHSVVTTKVVPNIRRRTLAPEVRATVEPGSDVFTDALSSYDDLGRDYMHDMIDHAETYVRGRVHTNGLENFWSLLKRALKGTYVSVEPFHLFRYLDEQSFRYNQRHGHDGNRFLSVLRSVVGRRLTYKRLTGKAFLPAPA